MQYRFLQKELDRFLSNLRKIIECLDNNCEKETENHDVLVIINKLHFYAQDFFVNNELNYRSDSDALACMKKKQVDFINGVKDFQVKYLDGDKSALVDMKAFLLKWIEEHESSKV
ncbi:MAG: hypothetical protein JXL97_03025 [Bacteroidales bacterium]|nr:hypothetical protein [Bacteroidales bacterium]